MAKFTTGQEIRTNTSTIESLLMRRTPYRLAGIVFS